MLCNLLSTFDDCFLGLCQISIFLLFISYVLLLNRVIVICCFSEVRTFAISRRMEQRGVVLGELKSFELASLKLVMELRPKDAMCGDVDRLQMTSLHDRSK